MIPAAGLVAAVVGLFSRDRLVSFLFGIFPNWFLALLSLTLPFQGGERLFICSGWAYIQVISTVGFGFGLMGLGGVLYGEWEKEPAREGERKARFGVFLGILGPLLWFMPIWEP